MADEQYYWGTGRRKTSVARVRIKPGSGKIRVNKADFGEYFTLDQHRLAVLAPLKACRSLSRFDVLANVRGGGMSGQAGAVMLGIARALVKADESLGEPLREQGLLTRDPRMKERKKYGQPGARKRFQFSKR